MDPETQPNSPPKPVERKGVLLTAGDAALMAAYDLLTAPVLVVSDFDEPTIAFNQAARAFFGIERDATRFFLKEHYKMLPEAELGAELEAGLADLTAGRSARVRALVSDLNQTWFRCVVSAQPLPPRRSPSLGAVIMLEVQGPNGRPHKPFTPTSMLESLVWAAPQVGVSITPDINSPKLIWNDGMYALLGITDRTQTPSHELFLRHVHPDDHHTLASVGTALSQAGVTHWEGDFRLLTERGREVLVNAWVISQTNPRGSHGLASMIVSVEDEILATREAAAARRELEKFTYTISHDLRAPVRHIESFMTLLLDSIDERLNEDEQQYATFARQSVQKLAGMIQGMVDYSRLPTILTEAQSVDLHAVVTGVVASQFAHAADRITVGPLPVVIGRSALLETLFAHLISNAIKFSRDMPASPITITSGAPEGDYCYVEIQDQGVGFEAQHTEKLFEIFQRLHGVQEFAGLGIGLALSKRIVELHGGEITVVGKLGEGTRAVVSLPIAKSTSGTNPRADT